MASKRGGRASSGLTALVLATYGNACHLRMPGCTGVATTKDHLIAYSHGGTDTLENLRPACKRCNSKRQNRTLSGYGATIKVVIGPPAGGKTTYVLEHATAADVIIDLDAISRALMPIQQESTHVYPDYVRGVAIGARAAAIERATRLTVRCTVWIIHGVPHPNQLAEYRSLRYQIITIDPGREVVEQRVRTMRPRFMWPIVAKWYASGLGSSPALEGAPLEYALSSAPPAGGSSPASEADW